MIEAILISAAMLAIGAVGSLVMGTRIVRRWWRSR